MNKQQSFYTGLGKRKTSVAKVFLKEGLGLITVNNKKFEEFVKRMEIPVVHSLMGTDSISSENVHKVGLIGSYGNRWANEALLKSDLVISIGSRLDVRQIGSAKNNLLKGKKLIRVEVDPEELNSGINSDLEINCSINDFFENAKSLKKSKNFDPWLESIRGLKVLHPQINEQYTKLKLNPNDFLHSLSKSIKNISGYVVDVGQHQMWSAQSLHIGENVRFLTSGGLGAMGFALPALIGCAITNNGKFIAIIGDGCAQLSINELQTIKENNLRVVIIILNNKQHGMVAQFQETNVSERYVLTREGYSVPNFTSIAKAFGIKSLKINNTRQTKKLIRAINKSNSALLVEVEISQDARALPKMKW